MTNRTQHSKPLRIGFISTRFAGTDGVSLEVEKWVTVLESMGHSCYYFAGICDRLPEHSYVVQEADFRSPENDEINQAAFVNEPRPQWLTQRIKKERPSLKPDSMNLCISIRFT
jgi:mannosylglucosylglycerate synthase